MSLMAGMDTGTGSVATATTAIARLDEAATDEHLVRAVRLGDDRAFEELYARYARRIAAYVQGMVNDHGRTEDVTQEVFISALRRMRATDRPIAFKPWIYEIAKNACIDQFRRSRRGEEVSFDATDDSDALEARLGTTPTPDAAMDAKQQLDDLCGAFGGLSDTHHQILVLRELEGLSYREIGDRLGMSRPSVESTLFRARRRLTEEYDELVSGARCQAVQQLVAGGASAIGTRDRRRLARHVAHCQPCRRQAHAAGVDTRTLTQQLRTTAARKVAAILPLPALLRLRREPLDPATLGHAQAMAEPAAAWTKAAAAAAAVLVAGGAGMAGHEPASVPVALPAQVAPAPERGTPAAPSSAGTRRAPERPSNAAATRRPLRTAQSAATGRRAAARPAPAADGADARERAGAVAPSAADEAAARSGAPAPAAVAPRADGQASPPLLRGDGTASTSTGATTGEERQTVVKRVTDAVDLPLQEVQDLATKADGSLGQVVGAARDAVASTS